MILGRSKFTGIILQGRKEKNYMFLNKKGKHHTMTHGRDHLSVFGRKFNSLSGRAAGGSPAIYSKAFLLMIHPLFFVSSPFGVDPTPFFC